MRYGGEYVSGVIFGKNPKTHEELDSLSYMGACNLGSLFLHNFVEYAFTKNARINKSKLKDTIHKVVRMLDNIIEINKFPLKQYENYQKNIRTIGLGHTGISNVLVALNMIYGSKKAIEFTDDLTNFIAKESYKASIELAKEKGEFEFLDRNKFIQSGFIQKHIAIDGEWEDIANDILKHGIRNARLISVAPTGTLSLTFGKNCSSGLEPIFSLEYDRKVKIGGQDDKDIQIVKMRDYAYEKWLEFKDNPNCIVTKDKFVTAMDLPVDAHINMLKIIAFHTDMSCSKTINIPTEYSFEDTKKVYDDCYHSGIKGCTIFRPNPIRQGILISEQSKNETVIYKNIELPRGTVIKVDDSLVGKKRKIQTGCGSLHIEAFFSPDTGDMMEVFLSKGSDGGCNAFMGGLSRMISLSLRGGVPIEAVVDQLTSVVSCPSYAVRKATKGDTSIGKCCPDAVGRSLLEMQKQMWDEIREDVIEEDIQSEEIIVKKDTSVFTEEELNYKKQFGDIAYSKKYNKCPICASKIQHEGNCLECKDCGWSKCD